MKVGQEGRYEGHAVVVTGAARGIGRAYAEAFADEGANVICIDLDKNALAPTIAAIKAVGGRAQGLELDVSDEDAGRQIAEVLGGLPLKALINNAAFVVGEVHGFDNLTRAQWLRFFDVNTISPLMLAQPLRPSLTAACGTIINQVSTNAYYAGSAYGVSKAALIAMTQAMARSFAPDGVRVNAIAPGLIDTESVRDYLGEAGMKRLRDNQLLTRQGVAQDVASLALFLCSDAAHFINGQVIICDGGKTMRF